MYNFEFVKSWESDAEKNESAILVNWVFYSPLKDEENLVQNW